MRVLPLWRMTTMCSPGPSFQCAVVADQLQSGVAGIGQSSYTPSSRLTWNGSTLVSET